MKSRLLLPIIAVQAVIIVLLAWAVVYFGRDEFKLFEQREESEVVVPSRVTSKEGVTIVKVSESARHASGIATAPLQAFKLQPQARVFGTVVNIEPLVELRLRYLAALQEAKIVQPALARSQAQFERVRTLFLDDRNASQRALQTAQAEFRADRAKLNAAQAQAASVRTTMRSLWGDVLAAWATDEKSENFSRLMQRTDALIQITLGFAHDKPDSLKVAPLGTEQGERDATFVSASPQADPALVGRTFFYRAAGSDLRVGMRVAARMQNGGTTVEGVLVPSGAILWQGGKAWAYLQQGDRDFVRREVAMSEPVGDGWFNANGFKPGDNVVVSGAQLLLSEEFRYQIKNENQD